MTDPVRMALEFARVVVAVRRYVDAEGHLATCRCYLCEALAVVDKKPQRPPVSDNGVCT